MTELVVAGPAVAIGEDLVGLGRLLEAFLGLGVAGLLVGMVFERQATVGALQVCLAGIAGDAEDFVVVALGHVRHVEV